MIANDDSPDMSEQTLPNEATERIEPAEPTLPIDRAEPTLPMLRTLLRDPIDSSEFVDR